MAKTAKFKTVEEAAAFLGCPVNDQTKVYLNTLVEKAPSDAGKNKKELSDLITALGITGLDMAKENVESLKIRIIQHYYGEAMVDEMLAFAGKYNLKVDDDGNIFKIPATVKPIEQRKAGETVGSVGWLSIQLLQDARYADKTVAELSGIFPTFAEEKKAELEAQGVAIPATFKTSTTQPALQWYVNYCKKHDITIIERKRIKSAVAGSAKIGVPITLEAALAPKNFKKKAGATDTGAELNLDGTAPAAEAVAEGTEEDAA